MSTNTVSPEHSPPSRIWRWLGQGLLAAVVLGLLAGSVVFVDETEFVLVERLGVITAVYDQTDPARSDRGLHFKWPWPLENVRRFDRRLQVFSPPGREVFTGDRKNITTETYVCWRIPSGEPTTALLERPVVKFFRGLGNIATTEARLETRVRSVLSTELGHVDLATLLHVAHSEAGPQDVSPLATLMEKVARQVRQRSDETESVTDRLGIEIVDVGLKRINLPEGNLTAVYERMRKEREKIAQRYRSAGEAEKLVIESQARKQSAELLARAASEAARIRSQGEAEALRIRNQAHARDPEFYAWLRNLESYRKIVSQQTTLVLSASSPFLQLLLNGVPSAEPGETGAASAPMTTSRAGGQP